MARMFYLSLVYDADGYRRYDMLKNESLEELDKIIANFKDRKEILDTYFKDYQKENQKGRVCIVYEDLDLKKKQLAEAEGFSDEIREKLEKDYSYAHIIPILYSRRRLMNMEACLIILKRKLREKGIVDSIMYDKRANGLTLKTNKKYIFETEEERDYINRLSDNRSAIDCFLKRIKKASHKDQYFYCRTLIDICGLGISTVRTKVGTIKVREGNVHDMIHEMEYQDIMTDTDRLEDETVDMDSFYLYHDIDDIVRLSPVGEKPIGSIGKRLK